MEIRIATIETDPVQQQKELAKFRQATEGKIYFISNYLKVFEPRAEFGKGFKPFQLWDIQKDYIRFLDYQYARNEDARVEKPRDMGITLSTLAWMFHSWMFVEDYAGLLISLKEEEVKYVPKTKDSLMAKLAYFVDHLPNWLVPAGFVKDDHLRVLHLINPANGAVFTGTPLTDNLGRSKRQSVGYADEHEFYPNPNVLDNLKFVCNMVIGVSTVSPTYPIEFVERARNLKQVFEINWDDSPLHDDNWLEKKRREMLPHNFNREILKDRDASAADRVYPEIDQVEVRPIEYDPYKPLVIFADTGYKDETTLGYLQIDPDTLELYLVAEYVNSKKPISFYVPFLMGKPLEKNPFRYTPEEINFQRRLKNWRKPIAYLGDTAGKQKNMITGGSPFDILKDHDIEFKCNDKAWRDMLTRTETARNALSRLTIDSSCTKFLKAFKTTRYPERVQVDTTQEQIKYAHDGADFCTAFEAYCITEDLVKRRLKPYQTYRPASAPMPPPGKQEIRPHPAKKLLIEQTRRNQNPFWLKRR